MKSLKKVLCTVLTTILLISAVPTMADAGITVTIDGRQIAFDVPPQIINNRTMVPLRTIFESLGATVDWNNETKTVTSTKEGTTVSLTIDSPVLYVNGNAVTLDTPACIVNNRTLVPARAISEAFNANVKWDVNNNTVLITTANNTVNQNNQSTNNTNNQYNQTTNYSSAYQKLASQLMKKGIKTDSGVYGILDTRKGNIISIIYDPEKSSIGFSFRYNDNTSGITLFVYNDKPPEAICVMRLNDGSDVIFSGIYTSPQITFIYSPYPEFNDKTIELLNLSYTAFDLLMQVYGIDVKISDFGIAY